MKTLRQTARSMISLPLTGLLISAPLSLLPMGEAAVLIAFPCFVMVVIVLGIWAVEEIKAI